MRKLERCLYALDLSQILLTWPNLIDSSIKTSGMLIAVNLAIVVATYMQISVDGIRHAQIIHLLFAFLQALYSFFFIEVSLLFVKINLASFVLVIIIWLRFGEGDFQKCRPKGPYSVGHQTIYLKQGGNAVSVFYPVDADTY